MVVSALLSLTFSCSSSSFQGGIGTRCMLDAGDAGGASMAFDARVVVQAGSDSKVLHPRLNLISDATPNS
jgi:hypothetical protein